MSTDSVCADESLKTCRTIHTKERDIMTMNINTTPIKATTAEENVKIEIRLYDVWGNAKDGYEINDGFVAESEYPLEKKVWEDNKALKRFIRDMFFMPYVRFCDIRLDDSSENTVYFSYGKDEKPIGMLRLVA